MNTFAGYKKDFTFYIIGQSLFGMGTESLYVGQSAIISDWFLNYELSMSMAISSSIPLCLSFAGGWLTPLLYRLTNSFTLTFGFGFLICCISTLGVFLMAILDYKTKRHDLNLSMSTEPEEFKSTLKSAFKSNLKSFHSAVSWRKPLAESRKEEDFKFEDLKKLNAPLWITCVSCALTYNAVTCY